MSIEIRFHYTDHAQAIMDERESQGLPMPSVLGNIDHETPIVPVVGDGVVFGVGADEPQFIVESRVFVWESSDHLAVAIFLDVIGKAADRPGEHASPPPAMSLKIEQQFASGVDRLTLYQATRQAEVIHG